MMKVKGILQMNTDYLSYSQLAGFHSYKYSAVDTNPVGTYLMHPFWNYVIKFFPMSIAPNVLTFTGFLYIIASFLLLTYYDYSYYACSDDIPHVAPIPTWVYALVALNIFISYSLDGIDGKQARRTGTSGPLGELFDHGLDSWTTVFIPSMLYSLFGRLDYSVPPERLFYVCCAVYINFYLSHVEKYNTGTLYLPWSYDFSMLGSVVAFFLASLFGHRFWKHYVFGLFSVGCLLENVFYLSGVLFNIPMAIRFYNSYKNGTNKYSLFEGLRPLLSLVIFLVLFIIWVKYSPTNIVEYDPRVFYLLSGSIFSNICCRLIIAQMTNTRCETVVMLLPVLFLIIIVSIFVPVLEVFILYLSFVLFTIYHIYYGVCIVRQMCHHFQIACFDISDRLKSQ